MAGPLVDARLRITAETAQAVAKTREVKRELGDLAGTAGRSGIAVPLQSAAGASSSLLAGLRGVAGLFATGALVAGARALATELVRARIDAEKLQALFRFTSGGDLRRAAEELAFVRRVASELGLELQSTAELYGKLQAASKGTRLEGEQTREIFLALAKAATVYNFSTAELQGALTAIQQIISKGKVSAEELRGQLGERLPGAVQIAARALGITTQELDKLLEKGELIAEDFLPKFARQLERELGSAAQQAAQGTQQAINRLTTASQDLKKELSDAGAGNVALSLINGLRDAASGLAAQLREARAEGKSLFSVLLRYSPSGLLFNLGFKRAQESELAPLTQEAAALEKRIADLQGRSYASPVQLAQARDSLASVRARIAAIEPTPDGSDARFQRAGAFVQGGIDANDRILARRGTPAAKEEQEKQRVRIAVFKAAYDAELELLRDSIEREKALNEQRFQDGLIGLQEYMAERTRLEDEAAQRDIQRLQAELDARRKTMAAAQGQLAQALDADDRQRVQEAIRSTGNDIARLETEIAKKKRDQADASEARLRDERKLGEELKRQLDTVRDQLAEARGEDLTEARIREMVTARLQPQIDRIKQLGGDTGPILELVNVETTRAQLAQVEREFARVQSALATREAEVSNAVAAGTKTQAAGEREILALRRDQIPVLDQILARMEALAKSPEERQRIADLRAQLDAMKALGTEIEATARSAGISSISTALTDIATGAKKGKEALLDMVGSFARAMLDVLNRRLAEALLDQFSGALKGANGGGFLSSIGNFLAGLFHEGGKVGYGVGTQRAVSPLLFALAPRFHDGLLPGEFPAILERGETVRTEEQEAALQRSMSVGGVRVAQTISVQGVAGDDASARRFAEDIAAGTEAQFEALVVKNMRPGGLFAGLRGA